MTSIDSIVLQNQVHEHIKKISYTRVCSGTCTIQPEIECRIISSCGILGFHPYLLNENSHLYGNF